MRQRLTGCLISIVAIRAVRGQVSPGVIPPELAVAGQAVMQEARQRQSVIEERLIGVGQETPSFRLR